MKHKLLIFIITYKASFRILEVFKKLPFSYLKQYEYTVYISDDASNDNTIQYIKQLRKKYKSNLVINENKSNLGYGGNIKKCIKYAYKNNFNYAVMIHGDNQYNPKYMKKMFDILIKNKNYSAVTGSRMLKKKDALKGNMPIYKFLGNIFLTKIFNLFYQTKFSDCHTGYWAYNLNKIELFLFNNVDNRFCFDIDMRLLLTQNNLKIKEIPIKTFYGNERSSIHIIYAIRFFLKTLKFKLIGKL